MVGVVGVAVHAADRTAVTGVSAASTSLAFVGDARSATADLAADGHEVASCHEGWWPLHAAGDGGSVGLHAHEGDPPAGPRSADDPVSPAALVSLGFVTTGTTATTAPPPRRT